MNFRIEKDAMGIVKVPADKYWGAQTQRSLDNFKIGHDLMPIEIIRAFAVIKKASSFANCALGVLPRDKADCIAEVCDEIIHGTLDDQFPLVVWQTGSGTQSNMNVNEVIANRAHVIRGNKLGEGETFLHPHDDVNKSQSSNDTFSTAMHIAAYTMITEITIPGVKKLQNTLAQKVTDFKDIIKIGRTHWMDATPLTLGQEFSGYVTMLEHGLEALDNSLKHLSELALGGTAVGTGLNCPAGYTELVVKKIVEYTGVPFVTAPNKFQALAAHNAMVEVSGALKQLAASLNKIANDIRIMSSGPRGGIGEINIPENEPGSSMMPGKVNPTQVEALTMVCIQVIANDTAITMGDMSGFFELNVYKPMIIFNLLRSARLLGDACVSFSDNCAIGIVANIPVLEKNMKNSLMLATALNTHIGYENAARIAKQAHTEGITLKQAALESGLVTDEQFDQWVEPEKMLG
jgi:fumarate hydratase, class II